MMWISTENSRVTGPLDKIETGVFERKYFTVPTNGKIADIERYWVGYNKLQISTGGFVLAEKKE